MGNVEETTLYHILIGNEWLGPISRQKIKSMIEAGRVFQDTLVSVNGGAAKPASKFFHALWKQLPPNSPHPKTSTAVPPVQANPDQYTGHRKQPAAGQCAFCKRAAPDGAPHCLRCETLLVEDLPPDQQPTSKSFTDNSDDLTNALRFIEKYLSGKTGSSLSGERPVKRQNDTWGIISIICTAFSLGWFSTYFFSTNLFAPLYFGPMFSISMVGIVAAFFGKNNSLRTAGVISNGILIAGNFLLFLWVVNNFPRL